MSTLYTLPMREDEPTWAAARQLYGPNEPVDVHIGWDADRATFFAQVSRDYPYIDGNSYIAEPVRVGTTPYEVRTARQALDAVAAWADAPPWLEAQLELDAGNPADRVATTSEPNRAELLWTDASVTEVHDATYPPIGAAPARAGRTEPAEDRIYHLPDQPDTRNPKDTFVGWDAQRGGYVAQVIGYADRGEGIEDVDVLRVGYTSPPVTDPRQVIAAVERYAVIPADLLDRLVADRLRPDRAPHPNGLAGSAVAAGTLDGRVIVPLSTDPPAPARPGAAHSPAAAAFQPLRQVHAGVAPAPGALPPSPHASQSSHRGR